MAASRPLSLLSPGQRLAAPAHSHDHYEERSMASTECLPGLSTEIDVGPGQVYSARCRSPDRQRWQPGHEGTLRNHTSADRSAVFPRVCRGDRRGGRRTAGPSEDSRDHGPPRPHTDSASGSGVELGARQSITSTSDLALRMDDGLSEVVPNGLSADESPGTR